MTLVAHAAFFHHAAGGGVGAEVPCADPVQLERREREREQRAEEGRKGLEKQNNDGERQRERKTPLNQAAERALHDRFFRVLKMFPV